MSDFESDTCLFRRARARGGQDDALMANELTLTAVFTPDKSGWTMAQLAEWPAVVTCEASVDEARELLLDAAREMVASYRDAAAVRRRPRGVDHHRRRGCVTRRALERHLAVHGWALLRERRTPQHLASRVATPAHPCRVIVRFPSVRHELCAGTSGPGASGSLTAGAAEPMLRDGLARTGLRVDVRGPERLPLRHGGFLPPLQPAARTAL